MARTVLGLLALLPLASPLTGQSGTVRVEENLRAEPNGVVIAVLNEGTDVAVLQSQGSWLEIEVEGWVWTPSTIAWDRGSFDLRVAADGGENLRSAPNGEVLAVLEEGALLEELQRVPGWSQVRRRAWIWAPSVQERRSRAREVDDPEGPRPESPAPAPVGIFRAEGGVPVLSSPNGDTLGLIRPGMEMAVTGRQGSWARVRMEGWVWLPGGATVGGGGGSEAGPSPDMEAVLANPGAYLGRIVTWSLQFVSLEAAEAIRTDFYEGEPFLLTRPVDGRNTRFVYVAIPPESLGQAAGLTPLEEITVVGRIRTGSSSLTGSPVVDLIELRRGG
jgi:hypothetical protein